MTNRIEIDWMFLPVKFFKFIMPVILTISIMMLLGYLLQLKWPNLWQSNDQMRIEILEKKVEELENKYAPRAM